MSFSGDVKAEICRNLPQKKCCINALVYGILLYCNTFKADEIKIVTECPDLAKILPKLFRKSFSFAFDRLPDNGAGKQIFLVTDPEKLKRVFDMYGYDTVLQFAHHINLGVLEEECCRTSFLKGAFLAGGSVTDPMKRYHIEFVTDHYNVSRELFSLLLDMGFDPKETSRGGNYITYFKLSEAVEDLLTVIGAPVSAMGVMSAKIEKEMMNSVNRRVNCDTANVNKTVNTAQIQLDTIRKIRENGGFDDLPEKLAETARLRQENPELSLAELAALSDPPVTKSCLNHRFRKLREIAENLH